LTVEHIVADGMGGNHELPNASCKKCRDITTIFERHFLRDMHRAYLGNIVDGRQTGVDAPKTPENELKESPRSASGPGG
jgi:hypothetical protein